MKLFLKILFISFTMALLAACGSSFEWFPDTNIAPVANAGAAQSVVVGTVVALDGSASSDANGNPLTYNWSFTSKPSGSTATLSNAAGVKPTFTADLAGAYILSLTVNDGNVNSAPATVTVTASASVVNVPPVAKISVASTNVIVGDTVTLDGSTSSDANSADTLAYLWSFTRPTGSGALLSNLTAVSPTFTADVAGDYVLSLTVNDGNVNSAAPATVTVTAFTSPPTANAGPDQSVITGATVQLDGSGSRGANLIYNWQFTVKPANSGNVLLSNATLVNPTFIPTVTGDYIIQLQVFDRSAGNQPDTVTVTVTPSNAGSVTVTW